MKKWFITLLALLLAFSACQRESAIVDNGSSVDPTHFLFNINIQHPDGLTKGVKTGWENGDKVFVFISGITDGYFTTSYNGTVWTTSIEGVSLSALGTSGFLYAIYLPYGNDATPSYSNNQWIFNKGTDTYYFYAKDVPYTVEMVGEDYVVSSSVPMVKPNTYVQFYVPYSGAEGTIQMACNALCPAGFASMDSQGNITESSGSAGTPVNGYADTLGEDEGYYVSGKPVDNPGTDYYFVIRKGDTYSHCYKSRSAIQANKAYRLASYSSWPVVGGSQYVMLAGRKWETVNKGADHPWELGDLLSTYEPTGTEKLPKDSDWNALMTDATWKNMNIWNSQGSLVVSNSNYIFLPRSTSGAQYWSYGFSSALQIGADGAHSVIDTGLQDEAYVRTVVRRNWFRIIAEADGTITSTVNKDQLKYSTDGGLTWYAYPNSGITVTSGQEICFKAEVNTWESKTIKTKKLYSSKSFRIAGDIASLLVGDNFDTGTATIPSGYSFVNFLTNCTELTDASELVLSMSFAPGSSFKSFFEGCTSLVAGPKELAATTVNANCYRNMFNGCTSLVSAPIIRNPSVYNGNGWYQRMFYNCSSLTEIVFLDNKAYDRKTFNDWNNNNSSMRGGWVYGVASSGTIYVNNAETDNPFANVAQGEDAVPVGWTVETYTP